jgi:hypothetical protein
VVFTSYTVFIFFFFTESWIPLSLHRDVLRLLPLKVWMWQTCSELTLQEWKGGLRYGHVSLFWTHTIINVNENGCKTWVHDKLFWWHANSYDNCLYPLLHVFHFRQWRGFYSDLYINKLTGPSVPLLAWRTSPFYQRSSNGAALILL